MHFQTKDANKPGCALFVAGFCGLQEVQGCQCLLLSSVKTGGFGPSSHTWAIAEYLKQRSKENVGGDQADEPGGRKDQRELERRQRLHGEDQVEESNQHPGTHPWS